MKFFWGEMHQVISDGFALCRGRIPIPMRFVKWSTFFIRPENYPSSIGGKKKRFRQRDEHCCSFSVKSLCDITQLETRKTFDF